MKNMIKTRNSIIIILCLTIIFLSVGFILVSTKLKQLKDNNTYNVVFENVKLTNSVKGLTISPTSTAKIINNKQEVSMKFTLNAPHDEISYKVSITNKGTLPAKIIDIMESPDYKEQYFNKMISPVTISLTDIKNKVIEPEETIDLKIIVYYNPSINPPTPKEFTYKIGLITKSN